jgi:hypothetical protein
MPPADTPSGPEGPHDDQPDNSEVEPITVNHLEASSNGEPPVEVDEGEEPTGVIAEPPAIEASHLSAGQPPEKEEIHELSERHTESVTPPLPVKTPAQLAQEHEEVRRSVTEHRAEFAEKVVEESADHPTPETTAEVVRTVKGIVNKRPVQDAQRGEVGFSREEGRVVYHQNRYTNLTDKTTGDTTVSAVAEFQEEVIFDHERADDESNEPEPPVKRLTVMLHSEDEDKEGYVEYSHEPEAANPWAKMEVQGGEITVLGTPTDEELRSILPCLENVFAHDEAQAAAEQEEKKERNAEDSKHLGKKTVALSETAELTDDETFSNLLERVATGEVNAEEVINAQLQKLTQECEFPFTMESTIAALYSLAEQLQPHLLEYDRMIVDDVSARVPSIIYYQLINEARLTAGLPRMRRFLVNGRLPAIGMDRTVEAYSPEGRTLIFTEYSYTGSSLQRLYDALKEREPEADVDMAIIGMDTQAPFDVGASTPESLTFFVGHADHAGGGALDLLASKLYPGVVKLRNEPEPYRWPRRYREQWAVNRSREDARHIAEAFSRLFTVRRAAPPRE